MSNDLFSIKGRVALVTGGSRGIGRMIAEGFLDAGAKVYISSRKAADCDAAAAEMSAKGECVSIPMDLSTVAGCKALAAEIAAREPKIDILVNNAGAAWAAPFDEFPELGWDKVCDLNVKSVFFMTQAMAPALRAAATKERPAKVINIASIDGVSVNMLETYSYAASKAGLIHMGKRMALRLVQDNIILNTIAPGPFPSEMNKTARDEGDKVAARTPAGRVGRGDDIAGAAIFLASRAGDYVVGDNILVDGGNSLRRGS